MEQKYDFSGWATRNDLVCGDGRTIRRDAFKDCDGKKVPLVWNHDHNDPTNVLGHAVLENRKDGVYAYCTLNDTEAGKAAKLLVQHGDVEALSIHANQLKQRGGDVLHGNIRELSMVIAGQNPGAFIDFVEMSHGEDAEDEVFIGTGEPISLYHADDDDGKKEPPEDNKKSEGDENPEEKTVAQVIDGMTEEQKTALYAMLGQAASQEEPDDDDDDPDKKKSDKPEGGDKTMKHNIFDKEDDKTVLSHSDMMDILTTAKSSSVGSLRDALKLYAETRTDTLAHGIDDIEALFPDYKDIRPGAPELVQRDQGWVGVVMQKVHKSPISRIRTRQMDARDKSVRARGYQKDSEKQISGNMKLLNRTTDPQTVYIKDAMNRDDKLDITDFDVVEYQYGVMKVALNEEIAIAIMVGDGREDGDEAKISEEHIRSVWNDNDLYTIHKDVDIAAAKAELQGTGTGVSFGANYIYAEAIITASLYAREDYKGTGTPDFFCTPHLLNVMLLARDMNGRRIYDSKADLAKALNVGEIHTAEQFEGLVRTTKDNKEKKLLGIFLNLSDYTVGATKGGEITRFSQFDIDFNKEKYLIETRLSGALTRINAAIALEEPVEAPAAG